MTVKFSTAVRNALLDSIETTIGASPTLMLRTGAAPATCATADSGTVLATLALPADWMAAAANGVKALSGSWTDATADATGTAAHFRIYNASSVCVMQGTVTAEGGGGDIELSPNAGVTLGQAVTIVTFALTAPGA